MKDNDILNNGFISFSLYPVLVEVWQKYSGDNFNKTLFQVMQTQKEKKNNAKSQRKEKNTTQWNLSINS